MTGEPLPLFSSFITERKSIYKKVLCTKDSTIDIEDNRVIVESDHTVSKGRVYTAIEEIYTEKLGCLKEDGSRNYYWYKLQETGENLHTTHIFKDYTGLDQLTDENN